MRHDSMPDKKKRALSSAAQEDHVTNVPHVEQRAFTARVSVIPSLTLQCEHSIDLCICPRINLSGRAGGRAGLPRLDRWEAPKKGMPAPCFPWIPLLLSRTLAPHSITLLRTRQSRLACPQHTGSHLHPHHSHRLALQIQSILALQKTKHTAAEKNAASERRPRTGGKTRNSRKCVHRQNGNEGRSRTIPQGQRHRFCARQT